MRTPWKLWCALYFAGNLLLLPVALATCGIERLMAELCWGMTKPIVRNRKRVP